ncbi:MAG: hypothetical protein PUD81_08580 [Eggerthellales bacterium]|nr:hypothetical protein [Eggerthellales bacterium]
MSVEEMRNKKRTPKEAVGFSALVLVVVIAVVALMGVCHVGAWVPFLALCLWAMKITVDPKQIITNYLGCAVGLTMGYLIGHASTLGTPALVAFFVMVFLLFITMLNQIPGLKYIFNDWTAVFCSVGTAMPYEWNICFDWLFAFVLFGVTVMIAGYFINKKDKEKAAQEQNA